MLSRRVRQRRRQGRRRAAGLRADPRGAAHAGAARRLHVWHRQRRRGGGGAHALREIEKLRREQNAALLAAIDAEQKRELQRERELEVAGASVTATADRERLIKVRVAPPQRHGHRPPPPLSWHRQSPTSHRLTSHLTRHSPLPLVQIFSLERSKADADLMELTAKHELALASKMAKLGMTR